MHVPSPSAHRQGFGEGLAHGPGAGEGHLGTLLEHAPVLDPGGGLGLADPHGAGAEEELLLPSSLHVLHPGLNR